MISPNAGQSYLYINNGDGTFTERSILPSVNTMNLDLFDISNDGYLDALKSEYSGSTTYNINNGNKVY